LLNAHSQLAYTKFLPAFGPHYPVFTDYSLAKH
jgi:hypothetical protein